jgi:AraC-like DNA-binding protein/quercetin dioxygenase-like cupin family protein
MPKRTAAAPSSPDFFSTQVSQARRFFLNLNPRPANRLVVVCGGIEQCAPNYVIQRPTFPFYSIEFVARGAGRVKLGRQEHCLQPGSVFSYGPGVYHELSTIPREPLTKYFVDFSGTAAAELLKVARLRPGTLAQMFPPMEVQPVFDELVRNGRRGAREAPRICSALLEALAGKILESRAPLPGRETIAFESYQRCRDHISRHFQRLRSVEEAARECHLDATYLCRLFKRYDHETPYRFLVRLKMNYAAERLQIPFTLVKEVADETGFANHFHFSRAFKAVFGISPSAMSKMR